jgi:hypothetical protein
VGAATSDGAAERVAQVYGVGAEASPGAAEAQSYQAEAKESTHADEAQKSDSGDAKTKSA